MTDPGRVRVRVVSYSLSEFVASYLGDLPDLRLADELKAIDEQARVHAGRWPTPRAEIPPAFRRRPPAAAAPCPAGVCQRVTLAGTRSYL
ncbi:MAG TPA: hypothetical protein VGG54_22715 [Trebonia sp.]